MLIVIQSIVHNNIPCEIQWPNLFQIKDNR